MMNNASESSEESALEVSALEVSAFFADTFFLRLRGLLFRREIRWDSAIWINPAGSIHTFMMKYPIDVVFLDEKMNVIKVVNQVQPGRIVLCKNAHSVLEFRDLGKSGYQILVGMKINIHRELSLRYA